MRNRKIKCITLAAVFAALITAAEMLHLPLFSSQGYAHLGDGILYIAASVLPFPYCAAAAALGGAMGDLLSGYFIWIPFTAVIKTLNVIPFIIAKKHRKSSKKISAANVFACIFSGMITCGLYFLASRVIYGSFAASLADLPANAVQAVLSAAIYLIFETLPVSHISIDKDD